MRGSHCFADLLAERLAPPRIHFLLCGITVDALAILASEASVHECSTVSERGNERLARLVGIDHDIHAIKTRKSMLSETDVVLVYGGRFRQKVHKSFVGENRPSITRPRQVIPGTALHAGLPRPPTGNTAPLRGR